MSENKNKANIIVNGIISVSKFGIAGFERVVSVEEAPEVSHLDFKDIYANVDAKKLNVTGSALTVYKYFSDDFIHVINAVQVGCKNKVDELLKQGMMFGIIPDQKFVLSVTLKGAYEGLFEAWNTAFEYVEKHNLYHDIYLSPWEVYEVMPTVEGDNFDDSKCVTTIYIPLLTAGKISKQS